ncbi:hypothetical protein [uncultured Psychroserpens sp.]|uniref:hypothetical protein n=1 Tax=uncultured Psychroserpens sp. TaxID=255436 RepID=UPI002621FE0B|nr:hypothetical protein [uncultured Psychroserpens sp.]
MSTTTQNWSWVMNMNPTLYNQLRNVIFSNIIPQSISGQEYDGSTIDLNFSTALTNIQVDSTEQDVLLINAPISGNTTTNGIQSMFKGSVSLKVYLDSLFISPCSGATETNTNTDGASWSNCLSLNADALSAPVVTLTTGTSSQGDMLTSWFQSSIDSYVASSPNQLGEATANNLNQYFAPTYIKFITLNWSSTTITPSVLMLVMVNDVPAPTGDQHSAFEASTLLSITAPSNCAIAFDDYTLYQFIASNIKDNDDFGKYINSATATQGTNTDPATLIIKASKDTPFSCYTGSSETYIADNALKTNLNMSNANNVSFGYSALINLINNEDGSQTFELENDETSSSVTLNTDSPIVISIFSIAAYLAVAFPVLGGVCFLGVWAAINFSIQNTLLKIGKKLEIDETKDVEDSFENENVTVTINYQSVTLDNGVILKANVVVVKNATESAPVQYKIANAPKDYDPSANGIGALINTLDWMHDGFKKTLN